MVCRKERTCRCPYLRPKKSCFPSLAAREASTGRAERKQNNIPTTENFVCVALHSFGARGMGQGRWRDREKNAETMWCVGGASACGVSAGVKRQLLHTRAQCVHSAVVQRATHSEHKRTPTREKRVLHGRAPRARPTSAYTAHATYRTEKVYRSNVHEIHTRCRHKGARKLFFYHARSAWFCFRAAHVSEALFSVPVLSCCPKIYTIIPLLLLSTYFNFFCAVY